jgi:hypothetical protein
LDFTPEQAQVPYIPTIKKVDDPGNFIEYPDSFEDNAIPINGKDREEFDVFRNF